MKRLFSISAAVFYFILTIGVGINIHYCGGEIDSISFLTSEKCCCGTSASTPVCCSDEAVFVQLDADQQPAFGINLPVYFSELTATNIFNASPPLQRQEIVPTQREIPPDKPLYELHCSFILYG